MSVNEIFGYNLSDEVTSSVRRNASTQAVLDQSSWSYDAIGNWLSQGTPSNMTVRTHNVMNQLTSTGGAGSTMVEGTVNAPSRGVRRRDRQPLGWGAAPRMRAEHPSQYATVTANGQNAALMSDAASGGYRFSAKVPVVTGQNEVTIAATDPNNETTTQTWRFTAAGAGSTLTYDANGNLTSDGSRMFTWDAKDRLKKVVTGGMAYEWDYDHQDRRVREFQYVSTSAKPAIPTRQFIWEGDRIVRERQGTSAIAGTVLRTHFTGGYAEGPSMAAYYLTVSDHLGNVRDVVAGPSVTYASSPPLAPAAARYDYSVFHRPVRQANGIADTTATTPSLLVNGRYYQHTQTGLELALYRAYDPVLCRWLNEDPIGERGGLNLYGYVGNGPVMGIDPLGLDVTGTFSIGTGGLSFTDNQRTRDIRGFFGRLFSRPANNVPLSFSCQAGAGTNNAADMDQVGVGPLPTGNYAIYERPGGIAGQPAYILDPIDTSRYDDNWDGRADGIQRGAFRLHTSIPGATRDGSDGCVVVGADALGNLNGFLQGTQMGGSQTIGGHTGRYVGTLNVTQ